MGRTQGGKRGKAEFQGDDLETEKLEDLLRSVASVGNDAGAVVQMLEEGKEVKRHKRITNNPVIIKQEEVALPEHLAELIHRAREAYKSVRGRDANG